MKSFRIFPRHIKTHVLSAVKTSDIEEDIDMETKRGNTK